MRIISGSARGRKLRVPESGTRPIPDRAKTAIFNMILSLRMAEDSPGLEGLRVLDLFAGSGSFGLECLSRGAAEVVFVEQNRAAAKVLQQNLDTIEAADRAQVLVRDAHAVIASLGADIHFDLAFCDPPYADDPWLELLPLIPADLLVAHTEGDLQLTPEWEEVRRRSYGRPQVVLARRVG
ncbi:MAG: 16S rRNA (guanine(966)-N(2))-methyltransferase RsmD [Acidimicrobiia bacterium]